MIHFFKEKLELKTLDDVLKLHVMIKSFEKGYSLSESDIDCLIELKNKGYNKQFFKNCIEKNYYKSEQTIRNSIGKMTNLGILSYKKRGDRKINKEFVPDITGEKLLIQYLILNNDNLS